VSDTEYLAKAAIKRNKAVVTPRGVRSSKYLDRGIKFRSRQGRMLKTCLLPNACLGRYSSTNLLDKETGQFGLYNGQATGWTTGVPFPAMQHFCAYYKALKGWGNHPSPYPMGTGVLSSRVQPSASIVNQK
jgi:hypothetical protein